jgi:hypothetical protein
MFLQLSDHHHLGFNIPPLLENLKMGFMKINWDASIDKSKNKMGIGVVVRDFTGKMLVTFCETKPYA